MAQATNTVTVGDSPMGREYFIASVFSNDVNPSSANVIVKAAPSDSGLSNYIEDIIIMCNATSATITILDDAAILIGPFLVTINETSGRFHFPFKRPIKLNGALNVTASVDSDIAVVAQGFVGK